MQFNRFPPLRFAARLLGVVLMAFAFAWSERAIAAENENKTGAVSFDSPQELVATATSIGSTSSTGPASPAPTAITGGPGRLSMLGSFTASKTAEVARTSAPPQVGGGSERSKFRTVAMEWLNRSGQRPTTKFGIVLDDREVKESPGRPVVVLVHGYNSSPSRLAPLQATISAAGYACGTFCYPNDQAIADSAELLSRELRRVGQLHPDRKIALVTHSMGGLVSRAAIETPGLDPGNVSQIIMIAPPSQGTSCAHIIWSGDLWEHFVRTQDHNILDCLYASLEDGMGEGREDLKPDSQFLRQLNARSRNSHVHYTMFLGNGSKFTLEQLANLRRLVVKAAETDSFLALMEPALQSALDDFEDSAQPGDGVVSISRGQLQGVTDTVVLGFDHWNSIDEPNIEAVNALHHQILKRLAANCEVPIVSAAQ